MKIPEGNAWEKCDIARFLPKLRANPERYVKNDRNDFYLCGNCASIREGIDLYTWLLNKIKQQHCSNCDNMNDFNKAIECAENHVRVSGSWLGWAGGDGGIGLGLAWARLFS